MSALSVDTTEASRLKVISEKIPDDIIESVGPAPKIGRPRWQNLADLLAQPEHLDNAGQIIEGKSFTDIASSDERFSRLIKEVEAKPVLPNPHYRDVGQHQACHLGTQSQTLRDPNARSGICRICREKTA